MEKINFKNKVVLAVAAHPDDNDFGGAATFALAAKEGAKVIYLVATSGQRGSNDPKLNGEKLAAIRKKEQLAAAKVLGVKEVHFLDYQDGELKASLELKEKIVVYIRKYKPDYVFTMDPSHFYYNSPEFSFINHTDHRAIGEATLDACYPLARNILSFPEHECMGLKPHTVTDLFLYSFMSREANAFVDIAETMSLKYKALAKHKTQFPKGMKEVREMLDQSSAELGKAQGFKAAEAFVRLKIG